MPEIPGIDHPKAIAYPDLLSGARQAGDGVAIIGAGGIGFDVATFLTHRHGDDYFAEWGIDRTLTTRGGVVPPRAVTPLAPRLSTAAQGRTPGRDPRQDHGLDSPHRAQTPRRGDARWRELRAHRR